jgi:competence protein ComEA
MRLLQAPTGRPLDIAVAPPVDLNRAGPGELRQLPGVGPKLSQRIADARDSRGGFESADDLRTVSGIGPARYERLKPWVRAEGEAPSVAQPPPPVVSTSKKVDSLHEPIDPNVAPVGELVKLPGVGPKLAQKIVDEREKRPFANIEDLRRVSGLGAKTLEKMRPFVVIKPVQ